MERDESAWEECGVWSKGSRIESQGTPAYEMCREKELRKSTKETVSEILETYWELFVNKKASFTS